MGRGRRATRRSGRALGESALRNSRRADPRSPPTSDRCPRAFHVSIPALFGLFCAFSLSSAGREVRGQAGGQEPERHPDSVTLQLDNGGRIVQRCTILDYDGKEITIRTDAGNQIARFPAAQVVQVETPLSPLHRQGQELFAAGRYAEAAAAFDKALVLEGGNPRREWVRREILALLVRCALRTGDRSAARARFDLLAASDPHTRHFDLIPLEWTLAGNDAAIDEARNLMAAQRDAARLMGAAMLLLDDRYAGVARSEMIRLMTSGNPNVAALARAQLWRIDLADGRINKSSLEQWRERIEAMPSPLRGGPYYVLGRAAFVRGEYDRAATFLLWVPLVHDADASLAARAGVEAAEALQKIGQTDEAIRVCRDVMHRFSGAPFARDAQALIEDWSTAESR